MRSGRLDPRCLAVLALLLVSSSAAAQAPDRLLMRDAVRYFELTPNQLTALTGIDASWLEYRASATERADRIEVEIDQEARRVNLDPAALGQRYVELETICRQSQARRLRSVADARGVLTSAQLAKLAVLEQALALMPIVQSAQSANLLSGVVTGPPAGMPGGTLDVEFGYVRSPVGRLPGCRGSSQVVRREWAGTASASLSGTDRRIRWDSDGKEQIDRWIAVGCHVCPDGVRTPGSRDGGADFAAKTRASRRAQGRAR